MEGFEAGRRVGLLIGRVVGLAMGLPLGFPIGFGECVMLGFELGCITGFAEGASVVDSSPFAQ